MSKQIVIYPETDKCYQEKEQETICKRQQKGVLLIGSGQLQLGGFVVIIKPPLLPHEDTCDLDYQLNFYV